MAHSQLTHKAFTLIELLVTMTIIAVLLAILIPALAAAKAQSRRTVCKSNVRQLVLANHEYATDNDGFYVAAAPDMPDPGGGLHRWHGVRSNHNEPFIASRGPLRYYLGKGGIKKCPSQVDFTGAGQWSDNFERGCGGYGYNMLYLGSRLWAKGTGSANAWIKAYQRTTSISEAASPGQTLMFADCALGKLINGRTEYIEYSFAEPPFTVFDGRVVTAFYLSPSLHFRHRGYTNVGWADGHVDERLRLVFNNKNAYGISSAAMNLGWFGALDNRYFDLK